MPREAKPLPSRERLEELFAYDPETGVLTWRETLTAMSSYRNRSAVMTARYGGKRAGATSRSRSYRMVAVDGVTYREHRVIFKLMTGRDPVDLDHINRDSLDNRWSNLREATHQENMLNAKVQVRDLPRYVHFDKERGKYSATVRRDNVTKHLGRFSTPEEAHAAALQYITGLLK